MKIGENKGSGYPHEIDSYSPPAEIDEPKQWWVGTIDELHSLLLEWKQFSHGKTDAELAALLEAPEAYALRMRYAFAAVEDLYDATCSGKKEVEK